MFKNPHILFLLFFILLASFNKNVLAQAYSGESCDGKAHGDFLKQFLSGKIPSTPGHIYSCYARLSSSYLPNNNVAKPKSTDNMEIEEQETLAENYHRETCRFTVYSLTDKDPKTAWCEGDANDGVGQVGLIFLRHDEIYDVKLNKPLLISNGYGKSVETFQNNNRVEKIRLSLWRGKSFMGFSSNDVFPLPVLSLIKQADFVLKDSQAPQSISFPQDWQNVATAEEPFLVLGFQILSVYKGKKFKDTCLSEFSQ